MEILKRIFTILSVFTFVVCCGSLLLFGWPGTGWKILAIPTSSMSPKIPKGSLVLVHRIPTSMLKVGDVITYINPLSPKTTVSHRIIQKVEIDGKVPGFITKGDANKIADVPVVAGNVLGKVVWHTSYAGYWLLYIKRPIVILPIVYILGFFTMIEESFRLKDYYKTLIPYRLRGYSPEVLSKRSFAKLYLGTSLLLCILLTLTYFGPIATAGIRSNVVSLVDNRITAANSSNQCNGNVNNNNGINISNSNTQNSSTGNASSNDGSTTSGGASNNSTTSISVNIKNC